MRGANLSRLETPRSAFRRKRLSPETPRRRGLRAVAAATAAAVALGALAGWLLAPSGGTPDVAPQAAPAETRPARTSSSAAAAHEAAVAADDWWYGAEFRARASLQAGSWFDALAEITDPARREIVHRFVAEADAGRDPAACLTPQEVAALETTWRAFVRLPPRPGADAAAESERAGAEGAPARR